MATYDNPRPSSQPVGSTDPAVVKDDLITLDRIVTSTSTTETNRKGGSRTTLKGLKVLAQDAFRLGAGDPQGDYVGGVSVYEKSNWTFTYNGQQWGLSKDFDLSNLPYLTTEADPNNDTANLSVRGNASQEYVQTEITRGQGENIGGKIFPTDDDVLDDGMVVTAGTTHLRVLVGGEPVIVSMSPVASGVVSLLTEVGATIGLTSTTFESIGVRNFSGAQDMIASISTISVGVKCSTGHTSWVRKSDTNGDLRDFKATTHVFLNDFCVLDGVTPDDSGFNLANTQTDKNFEVAGEGKILYLTTKKDIRNFIFYKLDLNGNKFKFDLTTITNVSTVADSLDYAFYFDGIDHLEIVNYEVTYGTVSTYTGVHRTIGVSEIGGDVGCGNVVLDQGKVTGGFSPDIAQGALFINLKEFENLEFTNQVYDNSTYPTGFTQAFRVLINTEIRNSGALPKNAIYKNIVCENSNNLDGDGILRTAGAQNLYLENLYFNKVAKPLKLRTSDVAPQVNGVESICKASGVNIKIVDSGTWGINADSLNFTDFKNYSVDLWNVTIENLTDHFAGEKWGVYLLPIHNFSMRKLTCKNLDIDINFRTYGPLEDLPRGTDKTFRNNQFIQYESTGNRKYCVRGISQGTIFDTTFDNVQLKECDAVNNISYFSLQGSDSLHFRNFRIGSINRTEGQRAIELGASTISTRLKMHDFRVYGNYSLTPISYSDSGNSWLGENLIYDHEINTSPIQTWAFPTARPWLENNKIWKHSTTPDSATAETADIRLGDKIEKRVVTGDTAITEWICTDATSGAYVFGENTQNLI